MIIIVTLIFTPLLIPLQWIEHLFIAIGQSESVSKTAATYIRVLAPFVIIYSQGMCYSFYATHQGKPRYTLYSTIIASVVHYFLVYYLALDLDMKMTGVALSSGVQFILRTVVLMICCWCDKDLRRSEVSIFHPSSRQDLGEMLKIGW